MRLRLTAAFAVSALALVAAGCGGSDEESDPTAAWAAGFCSAVTSWTDALQDVTSQFRDTSNLSEDGLQSAAEDVRTATEQLVDDLRGLGAPETESGEEIRSSLDSLSNTLEAESGEIESTVEGISGITGLPSAISAVSTSLSAMGSAFAETLQTIESADVDGELQSALEESPECADISG
jgi:inorganic triphosphatase YgiF